MLAAFFALGVYCIGHLTRDLNALGGQADDPVVRGLAQGIYRILPDLDSFNFSLYAVHGWALAPNDVLWPMLYAVGYVLALLFMATYIFRVRDLK